MYTKTTVGAVTLIGQKHTQRGIPCEDASFAEVRDGVSVVVIADGAGSKQYTHAKFGSASAVSVISDLLVRHFDAIYDENREAASRNIIIASLQIAFAELMKEHKLHSIEQLSCTLLFCAVKDRRVLAGHIGDGLMVRVSSSGISPLTMPQNDKAGHTYFVTANHAADFLRIVKTTVDDIHAIALMTDGVQDSVYDENSGLVKPVVARMIETFSKGRQSGEAEIKGIIEKFIVGRSNVSDDASFGVIYLNGTKAPDSNSLEQNADSFPRSEDTFKALQEELIPKVKAARNVIVESRMNAPVNPEKNDDTPKSHNPEPDEQQAPETEDNIPNVKLFGKRSLITFICGLVVEFIIILILAILLLR